MSSEPLNETQADMQQKPNIKKPASSKSSHDENTNHYQNALFGCFSNPIMCLWSLCVPCGIACMHATNFKVLDPNEKDKAWIGCLFAAFLCCFGTGYNRSKFRDDLKLKGSLPLDIVLYLFCPCCAAVQDFQEVMVQTKGEDKALIWRAWQGYQFNNFQMSEVKRKVEFVKVDYIDGPPLDFSFKELKELRQIIYEEVRQGQRRPIPSEGDDYEERKDSPGYSPVKMTRIQHEGARKVEKLKAAPAPAVSSVINKHNYSLNAVATNKQGEQQQIVRKHKVLRISTSINLSYNEFRNANNLINILNQVVVYMERLVWIDFSNNFLTNITQEFAQLPMLRSLYLHTNYISDFRQVANLQQTQIRTLTLYGNPIEELQAYKLWVIAILPFLKTLDTGLITMLERDNAVPLMGRRRLPMAPHPMNPPEPARQENSENDPSGRKGAK